MKIDSVQECQTFCSYCKSCYPGAYGCTIGGAGPTTVAVVADREQGEVVAKAMCDAYQEHGHLDIARSQVVQLDHQGARRHTKH